MNKPLCLITVVLILAAVCGGVFAAETPGTQDLDVFSLPEFKEAGASLSPEERFELASILNIYLHQYEQAIPLLEVLVKRQPNASGLWILLATAYNRVGEWQEAFDAARIAITLDPHYEMYYIERGIAAFRLGKDREAVEDLSRYVKSFATSAMAYYYLGLAQARLGDPAAARANLVKAGSLNPRLMLMTDYYVGLLDARSGRVKEAEAALRETLEVLREADGPLKELVRSQLQQLQAVANAIEMARALRRSLVEGDAQNSLKNIPKPQPATNPR